MCALQPEEYLSGTDVDKGIGFRISHQFIQQGLDAVEMKVLHQPVKFFHTKLT